MCSERKTGTIIIKMKQYFSAELSWFDMVSDMVSSTVSPRKAKEMSPFEQIKSWLGGALGSTAQETRAGL